MKPLLLLFSMICFSIHAREKSNETPVKDSIAESNFSLKKEDGKIAITIEYIAYAEGENNAKKEDIQQQNKLFDQNFKGPNAKKQILTDDALKKKLLEIFKNNPDLELEPQYPDYMIEIFNQIKGKKKRENARRLYIQNNPEKLYSYATHNSYTLQNGKYTNKNTKTFTIIVRPKKATTIIIPEFLIEHDHSIYVSKVLSIDMGV